MGSVLAKLGLPQAVGVYCDGQSVYVSHVTTAPLGTTEQQSFVEPLDTEDEPSAIVRALERLTGRRPGLRLVLGVPTDRSYLATRPVSAASGSASAKVLLRESLRCSSAGLDEMVADVVKSRPDKRELASIAACQREFVATLGQAFEQQTMRLVRAEPAPCALLRLAQRGDRRDAKAKVVVRVFLGVTEALALLTTGGRPILWRTVQLPQGDEATAILNLVRSLGPVAGPSGVEDKPNLVVVHGRTDIAQLVDTDWVREQIGVPFHWVNGPQLGGAQIAHGLALGGLDEDASSFDLAKEFHRPPTLWDIFPWRVAALSLAILVLMFCFLWCRKDHLEDACVAAVHANRQSVEPSVSTSDLEREKKDLQTRVSAVQRFLNHRVTWTACLRELSASLPDNVYLTSFSGDAEFEKPKKGKAAGKRSLVIKGAVSLPQNGSIPREVDHLLDLVRQHPAITSDFPVVELADLSRTSRVDDEQELAMFTFVCLPKGSKKRG